MMCKFLSVSWNKKKIFKKWQHQPYIFDSNCDKILIGYFSSYCCNFCSNFVNYIFNFIIRYEYYYGGCKKLKFNFSAVCRSLFYFTPRGKFYTLCRESSAIFVENPADQCQYILAIRMKMFWFTCDPCWMYYWKTCISILPV